MYTILDCKSRKHNKSIENQDNISHIIEEIKLLFYDCNLYENKQYIIIGDRTYHRHALTEEFKLHCDLARMLLMETEDILQTDNNIQITPLRKHLIDLLSVLRNNLATGDSTQKQLYKLELNPNLLVFKQSFIKLNELQNEVIYKLIAATLRTQDSQLSQYLHMHFDIQWLLLCIDFYTTDNIQESINDLMQQLIFVSLKHFEKNEGVAFVCPCFKSVWLRLQLFCEHSFIDFWVIFNALMQSHANEQFVITLLCNVAKIQCYNDNGVYVGNTNRRIIDNYDFLNTKWAQIIKNNDRLNLKMCKLLKVTDYLVTDLWMGTARLDFHKNSWDYFYKLIEVIDCTVPRNLKSFTDLITKIRTNSHLENDYEMFVSMLYRHLLTHAQHWNKFKGQIYTKFSIAKFAKLCDKGVFNLSLLMLTISSVNFEEISQKLFEMIKGLPIEKQSSVLVCNLYLVLIYLNLQNGTNIGEISANFLSQIHEASNNRSNFHLITLHVSSLEQLFAANDNLQLNQQIFIGPWIGRYTQSCQHNDLNTLLNLLICLSDKIIAHNNWSDYEGAFLENVLPALKQLALTSGTLSLLGPLLSIIVTNSRVVLIPTLQFFINDSFMVNCSVINPFFVNVLKYYHNNFMHEIAIEHIIIKAWIRACLIGEVSEEFTKLVFDLDSFKTLNDSDELHPKEHLSSLIDLIGIKIINNDPKIKEIVLVAFANLDKFVSKQLSTNSESILTQIYTYFALILNNCAPILYAKSIDACYLTKYINLLLLPTEILRGKAPTSLVLKAIEKTWFLYVQSLHELYLSTDDPHLGRLLKHLVVRYVPHFISKAPYLKLLNHKDLLVFALDKINAEFFMQQSRAYDEITAKALVVIKNLTQVASTMDEPIILQLIVSISLPALFESYIFKNSKGAANIIDTIKAITQSDYYLGGLLSNEIKSSFSQFTIKHLPFNTLPYFQLTLILTKIIGADLKALLPVIKEQITLVEQKRGKGFDNSLRQGFDRISRAL